LTKIIAERLGIRRNLTLPLYGPNRPAPQRPADLLRYVIQDDLIRYGFIPELVGRLPVVVTLDPLDRDALVEVLVRPRNALVKQYQRLLSLDGVELVFTEEALHAVAEEALERGSGARALRAIIERVLLDVMYEVPSRRDIRRVVVDALAARAQAAPKLYDQHGRLIGGQVDRAA
jgi:ATP-dependent Clp protease ATP-binding subunit ClpX